MSNAYQIMITDNRGGFWGALKRTFFIILLVAACVVAPIGIGIFAQSSAMQWVGFVIGLWIVLSSLSTRVRKVKSTDEARAYLDQIDRGTA